MYNSLPPEERASLSAQNSARLNQARRDASPDALSQMRQNGAAREARRRANARGGRRPSEAAVLTNEGKLRGGIPTEDYLGPLDVRCIKCGALHFKDEKSGSGPATFSDCCKGGKMSPERFGLLPYPVPLRKLFTDAHDPGASASEKAKSKQFLKNIRHYNNDCACASLSYKTARVDGPGPFLYKIQGTIYHYTFNIAEIRQGELARRNQLYILCTADQTEQRTAQNDRLRSDILEDIKHALDASNHTYRELKRMYELSDVNDVAIVFAPVSADRPNARNETLPEAREIVGVMSEGAGDAQRGVTIHLKSTNDKVFFNYDKGVCDPLTYPLLFPNGELGWDKSMKGGPNGVTPMHFYSNLLSIRDNEFNPILHARDLCQQYVVDCYTKVIRERLDFIEANQVNIWAEELAILQAHANERAERAGGENGAAGGRGGGRA